MPSFRFLDPLMQDELVSILSVLQIPCTCASDGELVVSDEYELVFDDAQSLVRTKHLGTWMVCERPGVEQEFETALRENKLLFRKETTDGQVGFVVRVESGCESSALRLLLDSSPEEDSSQDKSEE